MTSYILDTMWQDYRADPSSGWS